MIKLSIATVTALFCLSGAVYAEGSGLEKPAVDCEDFVYSKTESEAHAFLRAQPYCTWKRGKRTGLPLIQFIHAYYQTSKNVWPLKLETYIEVLLAEGLDPNIPFDDGRIPAAVFVDMSSDVVKMLFEKTSEASIEQHTCNLLNASLEKPEVESYYESLLYFYSKGLRYRAKNCIYPEVQEIVRNFTEEEFAIDLLRSLTDLKIKLPQTDRPLRIAVLMQKFKMLELLLKSKIENPFNSEAAAKIVQTDREDLIDQLSEYPVNIWSDNDGFPGSDNTYYPEFSHSALRYFQSHQGSKLGLKLLHNIVVSGRGAFNGDEALGSYAPSSEYPSWTVGFNPTTGYWLPGKELDSYYTSARSQLFAWLYRKACPTPEGEFASALLKEIERNQYSPSDAYLLKSTKEALIKIEGSIENALRCNLAGARPANLISAGTYTEMDGGNPSGKCLMEPSYDDLGLLKTLKVTRTWSGCNITDNMNPRASSVVGKCDGVVCWFQGRTDRESTSIVLDGADRFRSYGDRVKIVKTSQ